MEAEAKGQQNTQPEEEVSFVTMLEEEKGANDLHSPEPELKQSTGDAKEGNPAQTPVENGSQPKDGGQTPIPVYTEEEYNAMTQRLQTMEKRLKDTQRSLHQVCQERAELKKLQEKQKSDSWFEDGGKQGQDVEKINELDNRLEEINKKAQDDASDASIDSWLAEAKSVSKRHPDFDEVVFSYLYGKITKGKDTFDPIAKAAWDNADPSTRTPEGAYAFAVSMRDKLSALEGKAAPAGKEITGQTGLDLANNEGRLDSPAQDYDSFVNRIYK